jgi:hypothetical protein
MAQTRFNGVECVFPILRFPAIDLIQFWRIADLIASDDADVTTASPKKVFRGFPGFSAPKQTRYTSLLKKHVTKN